MKLKSTAAAVALLVASSLASATTNWDLGSYTVTYDETTTFGYLAGAFTSGGGAVGFHWAFSPDVQVTSAGGSSESATFAIPDFTISVNPGYVLSGGVTGKVGNVFYVEVAGANTSITAAASVTVDGGPTMVLAATSLAKVQTSPNSGYFADMATAPLGTFSSFSVSAASLTLAASGAGFALIGAQPQNELAFSFYANPVPEPETYAMLLAGLGVVGWVARRRRQH